MYRFSLFSPQEFDSDFIYDIDDTRSITSEPPTQYNGRYRRAMHSLDRYRTDDQTRYVPISEEYQLQPLLRVRSLKAMDHHTISAPSSPGLQPRYRSQERSSGHSRRQYTSQHGAHDQSSISKSASMPNGGFPIQGPLFSNYAPQQPVLYREHVIDRHIAERNASQCDAHRQHQRDASAGIHSNTLNRSLPIRYEPVNGHVAGASSNSYRHTNGHRYENHPTYFYTEQPNGGRSASYRQPSYATQTVGPHPTRIVY